MELEVTYGLKQKVCMNACKHFVHSCRSTLCRTQRSSSSHRTLYLQVNDRIYVYLFQLSRRLEAEGSCVCMVLGTTETVRDTA